MSNSKSSPNTDFVARFGRLGIALAATAVAASMFATPAEAGPFTDDRFGPQIGGIDQPCEQEAFGQLACSPDFTASASTQWTYLTYRNGVRASFFYVSVSNTAITSTDTLFTTVSLDQGAILDIEQWYGSGATVAPVDEFDGNSLWVIEHEDGLKRNEVAGFRVWVDGWNGADFTVETNRHVGIDSLGTPGPVAYVQREVSRANNIASGSL